VILLLLNKPFRVLSQFSPHEGKTTLARYIELPDVYPAGRLDFDSEGLLLLTDDGRSQARITHPANKLPKTYLVQVEGEPGSDAIAQLEQGVVIAGRRTRPAKVRLVGQPKWLWPREPPIRYRKTVPTAWLELILREGQNRQVRRMTAAVGHPALRLVRKSVGPWTLGDLQPGQWRRADSAELAGF
jgi:23S rRNA pseudouridine2457 synthase